MVVEVFEMRGQRGQESKGDQHWRIPGLCRQYRCADAYVISVKNYRGVKNRQPCAGIGDTVIVSVKKGTPEMRKQIFKAVIIRQRKEFRRPDGLRVKFARITQPS